MLTLRRRTILLITAGSLVLIAALAGCSVPTHTRPAPPLRTTSSATPTVTVDCDEVLPIAMAAATLDLGASTLRHPAPSTDDTDGVFQGAVPAAIRAEAHAASGAIDCEWTTPRPAASVHDDDGSMPAFIAVSVLPDAATAFAAIEPDADDGLNDFVAAQVGDEGYMACRDGEANQCRVETLKDGSWVSVTISPQPADHQTAIDLAATVATTVRGLGSPASRRASASCESVLPDDEVMAATKMTHVTVENDNELGARSNLGGAAVALTGLVACSWSSGDNGSLDEFSIVAVPVAAIARPDSVSGGTTSTTALVPFSDLGGDGFSGDGLEGCEPDYCEVDVLTDTVWLSVSSRGTDVTTLDELEQLAAAALTHIPA